MTTKHHHQNKHSQLNAQQTWNKQQIKDLLYSALYNPVQHHFKKRLIDLARVNSFLAGDPNQAFTFMGQLYNHNTDRSSLVQPNDLATLLHPLMGKYLRDLAEINHNELPYVLGYIDRLSNSFNGLQVHRSPQDLNLITNQNFKALGLIKQRQAKNLALCSATNVAPSIK